MGIPSFVASGAQAQTANAGGTSVATAWPAGIAAGHIAILTVESSNEPVNANAGWTDIVTGGVPQATGLVTGLCLRWLRYTGSETAPTVTVTGTNHVVARIAAFAGCVTSGSPLGGTPVSLSDNGTTTAVSVPGGTTTAADCLVVAAFSTGTDITSTTMVTGWTNGSLASPAVTEFFDNWHVTGNGGGFGAAYGGKATAGAYSATTATITTGNTKACASFALKGAAAASGPTSQVLILPPRRRRRTLHG